MQMKALNTDGNKIAFLTWLKVSFKSPLEGNGYQHPGDTLADLEHVTVCMF